MDGRTTAAVACAVAGGAWALLGMATILRRLAFLRSARALDAAPVLRLPPERGSEYGWRSPRAADPPTRPRSDEGMDSRRVLRQALRSNDPRARRRAVKTLGGLGRHHDWAVDALVEALAEGRDTPARVAAELDRLAGHVGPRLIPLLGHPASEVRFYAVRLLARHDTSTRRLAGRLVRDPSPNVRAAALETLRSLSSGDTLRNALALLDDSHPHVRAHAARTACSISGRGAAMSVVPLLSDQSWWVRDAARAALVAAGRDVTAAVVEGLDHPVPLVRSGCALVLQDLGVVDELLTREPENGLLQRIFAAGGEGLRAAAAQRARQSARVLRRPRALPLGAGP